ncbi:MAG: E3 binding domain-containing protein, partial [Candidatus Kapabacteria bacterium]|nr:E3 binding domain-containing protein [Candidatus Kapabacteria bacterium]
MRVEVVMPKMGESVQEGKIIRWAKRVGERVEQDETLLEISTDKVDTEIPSPASGVVAEILYPEGETVPVGKVIARIGVGESTEVAMATPSSTTMVQGAALSEASGAPSATSAPVTMVTPAETRVSVTPPEEGDGRKQATTKIPRMSGRRFYSPLVRTIAEAEGVSLEELERIPGTGVAGRVTKQDLLRYLEQRRTRPPVQ